MVLTGHCLCKAVTYTIDMDAPLLTGYDHCDDCQRQSGSTYCAFAPPSLSYLLLSCVHACMHARLPRPRSLGSQPSRGAAR